MNEKSEKEFLIKSIGVIRSCYSEKFGIPRQSGLVESSLATLYLDSPYNRSEMIMGLEQFSHIWVFFIFHATVKEGWKATVRPPGLGGQKRVGVFACRSPHRPNHIGSSAVRLLGIDKEDNRTNLSLGGGDFLDGTPVVDIKPYLPYSDALVKVKTAYGNAGSKVENITFSSESLIFCQQYIERTGRNLQLLIEQTLRQDPRPASQRSGKNSFGMMIWGINVRWRVEKNGFRVICCQECQESW